MSRNLPPDWQGYIQENDVTPKRSFSEYVTQKFGRNNNYLKNTADGLQSLIDNFLASGPVSITSIFIPFGTSTLVSPSGKQWFAAFMGPEQSGSKFDGNKAVIHNRSTHWHAGSLDCLSNINTSSLIVSGWNHEWSGWGLYET